MLSKAPLGVTMIKHQWDGEPHWSDVKSDMLTPSRGAPMTERVNQSWWKVQLPVARWSFEKKRHSLFNYCFFFFKDEKEAGSQVFKRCDVSHLWVSGKPGEQLWNEADGLFIHSSSSQFQKNNIWHFGISARRANILWKGQTRQQELFLFQVSHQDFSGFFFCLTWAMPPTNLVFTTTLSSSVLSNAAFWAAFTRLSEARFTALPAAFKHIISKLAFTESTCTQFPCLNEKNKFLCYLQSPHGFRILVSLHLAGHQQLSRGGRDLFSWGDELLLAGVALHGGVSCLTQVTGGCRYHTSLQQATHGLAGFTFRFNPGNSLNSNQKKVLNLYSKQLTADIRPWDHWPSSTALARLDPTWGWIRNITYMLFYIISNV